MKLENAFSQNQLFRILPVLQKIKLAIRNWGLEMLLPVRTLAPVSKSEFWKLRVLAWFRRMSHIFSFSKTCSSHLVPLFTVRSRCCGVVEEGFTRSLHIHINIDLSTQGGKNWNTYLLKFFLLRIHYNNANNREHQLRYIGTRRNVLLMGYRYPCFSQNFHLFVRRSSFQVIFYVLFLSLYFFYLFSRLVG